MRLDVGTSLQGRIVRLCTCVRSAGRLPGLVALALAAAALLALPRSALARPEAPRAFCAAYPDAMTCAGRVAECSTCHISTQPASWNAFGLEVFGALGAVSPSSDPEGYEDALISALYAVEGGDADGDGVADLDEILAGTRPGDETDAWPYCALADGSADVAGAQTPVAESYRFTDAYRRVMVLFCGRSPSYDELTVFAASAERAERYSALHDALATCLESAYWRDDALPRLADTRIRPLLVLGPDSPLGFTMGDYNWDYRLFSYVMTGDRDVRDLLLADYHVIAREDGTLEPVEGILPAAPGLPPNVPGGQPLEPQQRAGMITTQWFLMINTMGTAVPRGTAAQAYRSYLGADIAKQQGIWPVAGEPLDLDRRGVAAQECAVCHSTLDPLSYVFSYFDGFSVDPNIVVGGYDATRPQRLIPDWNNNQSVIAGQPVANLREWAARAVETEEFKRNVALIFFRYAFGREPTPAELPAFTAAWRALPEDGWSANALVHRIVDIATFGGAQ